MPKLLPYAALLLTLPAAAQRVTIDATAPVPTPQPVQATLGTATSPSGQTIGANSQYLTLNGQPWLPVMGEFHFSRYPAAQWEQEILKMQAAGVNIISTYIIWIHHEQIEGQFDWAGQRDLRFFTQLCAKHGMYVYPRIGPWAHAEVRNGGLPDWVLKAGPTRQNDPKYLAEVDGFYKQIAMQLKGLLWKDGGPVIGLQIENEYRDRGPGKGVDHIRTLKKMAVTDGLDVPLYTVTGWDGASIPLDTALPVFGGYPDAPWDGSPKKLPPNEVYAFRFANRSAGSMGAIGGGDQAPAQAYTGTPFLTAEVGDGIEDTYFRRPVVTPDDVAAIPTVILGSGANMLGYYMFHGGRNPDVEPGTTITLNESQATGYPTDLPQRSYDFQAPLGEYGQPRPSLNKLKLVHYFLNDFGAQLAPMAPRRPATVPATPDDVSVPRVSARTNGQAGYVFLSNHIRGIASPARPAFQIALGLPAGTVEIPAQPISLPAETYGIWPVNLPLGPTTLRYATAQLFKRVQSAGKTFYFFTALPGITPEFAFNGTPNVTGNVTETLHTLNLLRLRADPTRTTELNLPGNIRIVVLPTAMAEAVWRVANPALLVTSDSIVTSDANRWTLDSTGQNAITLGIFGSRNRPTSHTPVQSNPGGNPLFARYETSVPAVILTAVVTPTHPAGLRAPSRLGPSLSWRKNPVPLAPDDTDYALAAADYKIDLPPLAGHPSVADALLTIRYTGDEARLNRVANVLDDDFWNGIPWQIGLDAIDPTWRTAKSSYTLRILPLRSDYNLYLEDPSQLHFNARHQAVSLDSVKITPVYRFTLQAPVTP